MKVQTLAVQTLRAMAMGAVLLLTARASGITVHSYTGSWDGGYPPSQLVDGNEGTMGVTYQPNSTVTFDLGAVTNFADVSVTTRADFDTQKPDAWAIQVEATDNPAGASWTTVGTMTNTFATAGWSANYNAGRRVVFNPVNKRYFRWAATGAATGPQIAEIQVGKRLLVYGVTNAMTGFAGAWPANGMTDTNTASFFNILTYSNSAGRAQGMFVFDVLRTNRLERVTQFKLQQRTDAGSNIFPTDYRIRTSSTENPDIFDVVVTNGNINGGALGLAAWHTIDLGGQYTNRYYEFYFTNNWVGFAGCQIAQFAVTTIMLPPSGSVVIMK